MLNIRAKPPSKSYSNAILRLNFKWSDATKPREEATSEKLATLKQYQEFQVSSYYFFCTTKSVYIDSFITIR